MSYQSVEFPFIGPLDESQDGKVVPMPRLTVCRNLERVVGSETAIRKRPGTTQLAASNTALATPIRLATFSGELLAFDGNKMFTYSEGDNDFRLIDEIPRGHLTGKTHIAAYGSDDVVAVGSAATTEFIVHVWTTKRVETSATVYNVHCMVIDRATGNVSTPSTLVPNSTTSSNDHGQGATTLKVIGTGTKVQVVFGSLNGASTGRIRHFTISTATDPSSGTWTTPTAIVTNGDDSAKNWFDADAHATGSTNWVLGVVTTTANTIRALTYSDSTNVGDANISAPAIGEDHVAVVGNAASSQWALYVQSKHASTPASSGVKRWRLSTASATINSASATGVIYDAVAITACLKTTTSVAFFQVFTAASGGNSGDTTINIDDLDDAATIFDLDGTGTFYDMEVCTKPFVDPNDSQRLYFGARYWRDQVSSFNAILAHDMDQTFAEGQLEARVHFGQAANAQDQVANCIAALGGDQYIFPFRGIGRYSDPSLIGDPSVSDQVVDQLIADAFTMDVSPTRFLQTAELGGILYVNQGVVMQYDGRRLVEVGFASLPSLTSSDFTVGSTGGTVQDGTYIETVLYEWYDAQGNRHQSDVDLVTVTVAEGTGTAKITINIPPLRTSRKDIPWPGSYDDNRPIVGAVYRTIESGEALHRLEGATGQEDFSILLTSTPSQGYADEWSDSDLALSSREFLYTSALGANELGNMMPPCSSFIVAHQDRLWGIMAEDPTLAWYSKYRVPGTGLAWNFTLVVQFQDKMVALASQDGNLVGFGEHTIYTVADRVTDNTGNNTTYDPPRKLSGEVGCAEARSVVTSPKGIFFLSQNGLYILPRGGSEPLHIGKPVEKTLAAYPTIVGALHVPDKAHVRFACVTAEGSAGTGRVLVYDYDIEQWFVWDYGEIPISSIALHNGKMVLAQPLSGDQAIWREDTGSDDPSGYVSWTMETGDIRLGGNTGYHRMSTVTVLGRRLASETLTLSASTDGGSTYPDSISWDLSTAETEVVRQRTLVDQQSGRHRLKLEGSTSGTADSAGIELYSMQIEGKRLRRPVRLSDSDRS